MDIADAAGADVTGVFALIAAGETGVDRARERTDAPVGALTDLDDLWPDSIRNCALFSPQTPISNHERRTCTTRLKYVLGMWPNVHHGAR